MTLEHKRVAAEARGHELGHLDRSAEFTRQRKDDGKFARNRDAASLRFDRVKIDRGFVAELPASRKSRALVTAILGIAQEFDLTAVAEGIETDAQREFLRDVGCPVGQGFLHERPIPLAQVISAGRSAKRRYEL